MHDLAEVGFQESNPKHDLAEWLPPHPETQIRPDLAAPRPSRPVAAPPPRGRRGRSAAATATPGPTWTMGSSLRTPAISTG